MKNQIHATILGILTLVAPWAHSQSTAFTYQGRLTLGGAPVSGNWDITFKLYDDASAGSQVGGTLTNTAVAVNDGLFTTTLDFGTNFPGASRWLEVAARTNGSGPFATLNPRNAITPTPYAIYSANAGTAASANSVSAASITGTLPLAQLPPAVLTNNSGSVNLTGTFTGNGAGLTNVANIFRWQVVSGTNQQAQPNTGYVMANTNQMTITLPVSPSVGDSLRVFGMQNAGSWKIAQNAGQLVLGWSLNLHNQTGGAAWNAVASSADGSKLVAVVGNGQIYTSTDSGANWTAHETSRAWRSVASSADGSKLVAVVQGGQIYTSTDSGTNWTAHESNRNWGQVASSADGVKLVAVVEYGGIYTSTDSGTNWTERDSLRNWFRVASSADGSKLVAAVWYGQIYTSTDSGTNWTARESSRPWYSVASSADGSKLVAVTCGQQRYTSTDSGVTWTAGGSNDCWVAVASSADGSKLVAANGSEQKIYTSTDSGTNWTARGFNANQIASSADGSKLVAANLYLYTSTDSGLTWTTSQTTLPSTTPGTTGYVTGDPWSYIELVYIGNNQFLPVSWSGVSGY